LFNRIAGKLIRRSADKSNSFHQRVVSLSSAEGPRENVLLAYIIDPFLRKTGEPISNSHTHHWESFQIAQTFLKCGFNVDVISYLNASFKITKNYRFFVSARTHLEKLAGKLNKDCTIVAHLDTAHWITNNHSAYSRLSSLLNRRRVALKNSIRVVEANLAIEHSHIATVLGNDYTVDTYQYAGKPIVRIPISTTAIYEWNADKQFDRCRNNFLWFGSSGFVHKGLDLVLEAFARMPNYHLTVCGPLSEEKGFVSAYHKELYETPNIHTVGWVDVTGSKFREIAADCVGLVYPSCAEGGGGSAITCMHAGVIPLLSREASVDIDDGCGVLLRGNSVTDIMEAVKGLAELPAERLQALAKNAWTRAREMHTRERFAEEYERFVTRILLPGAFS
jgi:glycosyltransferase involved in cell wall biosynthesis